MGQGICKTYCQCLCPDRTGKNCFQITRADSYDQAYDENEARRALVKNKLLAPVKPSAVPELDRSLSNRSVRIVIIGDSGVGKTSITRRYINGYYAGDSRKDSSYSTTLGVDFGCKTVYIGGKKVKLQVWDTSGNSRYSNVISHYLHSADGVVLVYDISSEASFKRVQEYWQGFVEDHAPKMVQLLLIGNKADMTSEKAVDSVAAQDYADLFKGRMSVFETSAYLGDNVHLAMLHLLRSVLSSQNLQDNNKEDTPSGSLWTSLFSSSPTVQTASAAYLFSPLKPSEIIGAHSLALEYEELVIKEFDQEITNQRPPIMMMKRSSSTSILSNPRLESLSNNDCDNGQLCANTANVSEESLDIDRTYKKLLQSMKTLNRATNRNKRSNSMRKVPIA